MGLLLRSWEKLASPKDPHGFHDSWKPDVGWKGPSNPTGWRRPKKKSQRKELYLWDQWQKSGQDPEKAEPLVRSLQPLIWKYGVQTYANRVPIQTPVLEGEALRLTLSGLERYDPSKAQINTFTRYQLRSMDRFVKRRQNAARITEERAGLIGKLDSATSRLKDRLGREPTLTELADEMMVPAKTVEKLLQERKEDLLASGALEDPFIDETPRADRALRMVRYHLTKDEEIVFDYLTGSGTRPLVERPGEIARLEGWSPSKVSQLKNSIAKKLDRYL